MAERLATNVWVILASMRLQSRTMRGSPFAVILGVIQPVVFLVISTSAAGVPDPATSTQLVIGVGLTALWGSTIWSAGGILRRDQARGTFGRALLSIRSPFVVFLGECLGATVRTTTFIAPSTVGTALLLGVPIEARRPAWMAVCLVVVVLSGTALGMLLSCLFLVTRHAPSWSGLLMYPVFIVSGLMIPQDLVPTQLRWVSAVISLRWAAHFLATAAFGHPSWFALVSLTGLTVGYFVLAVIVFRWLVQRARRNGTLDHG